jgi:hypothetical protein
MKAKTKAKAKQPQKTNGAAQPNEGQRLLDDVRQFIGRFCVLPDEHALIAVTLWAEHAHMVAHFYTTPRLTILSPEASCGKTRLLEVLDLLVPEPFFALNASPATVFRTLETKQIAILFDEVDTVFTERGKDNDNVELRGLLNAGYKKGAMVPRCVGPTHFVKEFPVFAACALAAKSDELPDTIMTRSVILRMRRRAAGEPVDSFRSREQEEPGHALRDRLFWWATKVGPEAGKAYPAMPEGIVDRPQEVWEPLVAVADAAGGTWPAAARAACVDMCKAAGERRGSLGVRLLADLKVIFGISMDAMFTAKIIEYLTDTSEASKLEPDAPWSDMRGKPIDSRKLSTLLGRYQVRPVKVRIGKATLQGYRREDLHDAWVRYLPAAGPVSPEPAEQPEQSEAAQPSPVPLVPDVPDFRTPESEACPRCGGQGCEGCTFLGFVPRTNVEPR